MDDMRRRRVTGEHRLGIPEDYAFPQTAGPANVDHTFRAVRLH